MTIFLLTTCDDGPYWPEDDIQDAGEEEEMSFGFKPVVYYDVVDEIVKRGKSFDRLPPMYLPGPYGYITDITEVVTRGLLVINFCSTWCAPCMSQGESLDVLRGMLSAYYEITWVDVLSSALDGNGEVVLPVIEDMQPSDTHADYLVADTEGEFSDWLTDHHPGEARGYPTAFVIDTDSRRILTTVAGYPTTESDSQEHLDSLEMLAESFRSRVELALDIIEEAR